MRDHEINLGATTILNANKINLSQSKYKMLARLQLNSSTGLLINSTLTELHLSCVFKIKNFD